MDNNQISYVLDITDCTSLGNSTWKFIMELWKNNLCMFLKSGTFKVFDMDTPKTFRLPRFWCSGKRNYQAGSRASVCLYFQPSILNIKYKSEIYIRPFSLNSRATDAQRRSPFFMILRTAYQGEVHIHSVEGAESTESRTDV